MKLTDPKVIQVLKRARCYQVQQDIDEFPENEKDGKTDLEIAIWSADYILERMEDPESTIWGEPLVEAKKILRETDYGKFIPFDANPWKKPFEFIPRYADWEIKNAKEYVNEYKRTKNLVKKLHQMEIN